MSISKNGSIHYLSKYGPNRTDMATCLWNNVACSGILYGTEAIILTEGCLNELESAQASFAKGVLGVRQSTSNMGAIAEMGFKTMRHRLYEQKI